MNFIKKIIFNFFIYIYEASTIFSGLNFLKTHINSKKIWEYALSLEK